MKSSEQVVFRGIDPLYLPFPRLPFGWMSIIWNRGFGHVHYLVSGDGVLPQGESQDRACALAGISCAEQLVRPSSPQPGSMKAFISHNAADKETARLLASLLVNRGIDVWFDEWKLRPGDSITGGIETGIGECDTFVIVWSASAKASRWVSTELRAAVRRRVDDEALRVIPILVDDTPLPTLVADYRGFQLRTLTDLTSIARDIAGDRDETESARRLQKRLLELALGEFPADDPITAGLCPRCASTQLVASIIDDSVFDDHYYQITCCSCDLVHRVRLPAA